MLNKVQIVLVEWNGYPLIRKKRLGENKIVCGVSQLLEGLDRYSAGLEFDLHLVVNCSDENPFYKFSPRKKHYRQSRSSYEELGDKYSFIKSITYRGNEGMDLGAYNEVYHKLLREGGGEHILFMNSSVLAPQAGDWLKGYADLFQSSADIGVCGISMNSHNTNLTPPVLAPHIQSFFIYTSFNIMAKVFSNGFPIGGGGLDKLSLIENGEIGISRQLLDSGYSLVSMAFPEYRYQHGLRWDIPEGDIRFRKEYKSIANQI